MAGPTTCVITQSRRVRIKSAVPLPVTTWVLFSPLLAKFGPSLPAKSPLGVPWLNRRSVVVYVNGNSKSVTLDRPQVRRRQMRASVRVRDGQTVVLGAPPAEKVTKTNDQLPMLARTPLAGPAFRIEPETTNKQTLLIFVTPTLIDPAGNLIHAPDETPLPRGGTAPQPAR